jgi:hypothetical protein
VNADVRSEILTVLPGATIRETRDGLQVGGFSCPPVVAQTRLRAAGIPVRDHWGATIVDTTPREDDPS